MADAVAAGQLGPEADSDEAVYLVSSLIVGVLSQAMSNEPDLEWGEGRFTPTFPKLMRLFAAAYPVPTAVSSPRSQLAVAVGGQDTSKYCKRGDSWNIATPAGHCQLRYVRSRHPSWTTRLVDETVPAHCLQLTHSTP